MKVLHTWICFFFLSLCGRDNRLVSAKVNIFAGAEGGRGSISCYMYASGSKKFFCKNQCKAEEILVKTEEVTAQNGRLSIKYEESSGRNILSMTISNVTKSDAGRYRFGVGNNSVPDSYCDIEVMVLQEDLLDRSSGFVHADIEGENITQGCSNTVYGKQKFLCKGDCQKEEDILVETEEDKAQNGRHSIEYIKGSHFGLHVTFTNVTKSDTGRYKCGYGRALSPDSARKFSIFVIQGPSPSPPPPETTLKPETTSWSSAAAPTTSTPSWTSRPSSASVLSDSTQSLLLYVMVIIVVTVIVGLTLMIVCIQRRHKPKCWRSRGNSGATKMEIADYENCPPVSPGEDSTYQNLDPASWDQDQIYATITDTQC